MKPLFEPWTSFFGEELKVLMNNIETNREIWKERSENTKNQQVSPPGPIVLIPTAMQGSVQSVRAGSKLKLPPILASSEAKEEDGDK